MDARLVFGPEIEARFGFSMGSGWWVHDQPRLRRRDVTSCRET
jgi:hypothetical protein